MTQPSLPIRNSGLRVFNAALLSALLIMMPFVQLAAASRRESAPNSRGPETARQATDNREQTAAARENVFANAPVPKPAPEAPALLPAIVATKDDGLATATTVAPDGTINYSVNIKNNGATSPTDDATGVTFTDIIDAHTTLVVGSAVAAVSDRYNAIGNVQLSIPDGSTDLLANDIDPDTGNNTGMTVTAETKSSTQCTGGCTNNVTINANGSFTYNPPVGFSGTDTFTYTAHSTVGPGTATETVTITVANEIWFINNNAGACPGAPCDGRLSHPFVSLAAFTAANLGGAGQPGDNDWIFIYESATDYAGPATLRLGQKFIGQDATASLATLTGFPAASGTDQLPVMNSGNGVFVNITGANVNGINLNSGNTLRGFRVGNVGTGTKISGTSFGTLVVGNSGSPDVLLHGTGQALSLTTGVLLNTGGFTSVTTTSSATQGISLSGVTDSDGAGAGSFSFGSTTVSGSTTQGILIGTTPADLNFGATSVTGGTNGISFQNNSGGTRTFGTLGISGSANEAFLHAVGGGNVTVTGAATLSSVGSAISVSAPAATTAINFQAATSATSSGVGITAVNWVGAANTSMSFNSLSIQRNGTVANPATALNATGGGTINVTNGTGSINNTTSVGPAIVAANIALNANFLSINSSGGPNGVSLTAVTGTSNFGTGQLTGTGLGTTFAVSSGTATVTYSGNITQALAATMVSILDHGTGTITFQTGTLSATLGTGLQFDNADGTYNFSGTTTLNGGNAGIDILNGSGGTFSFGANTTITNPSGVAVNVDGSPAAVTGGITLAGSISKTSGGRLIDFNNYDTGTANISATLTCNTSCDGLEVTNDGASSGTVNFTASTKTLNTVTDTAVNLNDNDGGAINFTGGGLDIDTTTGNGFVATNGGTVTIQGSTNSVTSTTGTNVNISDTTIGAGNVTFERIDHNGNNTAIILDDTGSGTFTVNGTGTTDGSGGTIENITASDAITFLNTDGLVTLKNMIIEDIGSTAGAVNTVSGHDGIHGQQVDGGLTLDNIIIRRISDNAVNGSTFAGGAATTWNGLSIVNGCLFENTNRFHVANVGDANNEGMVRILGLTGTVNVTDSTLQDGAEMLDLFPNTGTMTLTVTNNTFHRAYKEFTSGTTASVGGHCIDVTVQGSGNAVVNIGHRTNNALDNDFLNCRLGSIRVANDAAATGTVDVMIGQNEFTVNDHSSGITGDFDFPMGGVLVMSRGTNTAVFQVVLDSNYFDEITNASGGVGQFSLDMDGGQWEVIAEDNTFDTPGNAPWFIRADNAGNVGTMNSSILLQNNNYIRGAFCSPDPAANGGGCNLGAGELCGGQGYCGPGLRSLVQVQNGANINFTLNSDDLKHHDTSFDPGNTVEVQQLNVPIGGNNGTVCTNFTNNTAADGYSLEHFNTAVGTFNLQKGASNTGPCVNCSVAQIQDVFDDNGNTGGANNPATDPPTVSVPFLGVNVIAGTCTQPSIPFAVSNLNNESAMISMPDSGVRPEPETQAVPRDSRQVEELLWVTPPAGFDAADGFAEWRTRRLGPKPTALEQAPQNPVTPMPQNPATFEAPFIQNLIYVPIINLSQALAESEDKDDAAKKETSKDNAKEEPKVELKVEPTPDELLKVEPVNAAPAKVEPVKAEPAKTNAEPNATAAPKDAAPKPNKPARKISRVRAERPANKRHHARALAAPISGETVTANIGTLPAGGSVTITFQVTVDNPPNLTLLNPPRVENQGTVAGSNFVSVLTDDPNVVGSADKTATRIDLFDTSTTLVSDLNPSNDGDTVTFTATINETPVQGSVDPTGTVDFIDTSNGNAVICNDVPVSSSVATCQTSTLSAGSTHNIRADYSGDGNFDPSQSNIVAQVVNACVQNPVVTNTANSGAGSLRDAMASVCSAPNNNITFNIPIADPGLSGGVYTITLATELVVGKTMNITGPNSVTNTNPIVVSGNNVTRVFHINATRTATISGLTISNGAGPADGGGIFNLGTLNLIRSTISGNNLASNYGGGIFNGVGAVANINDSTISGNTVGAGVGGGGVRNEGTMNITNSTISGNGADDGGGINNSAGTLTITNSTITNNRADNDNNGGGVGGGIFVGGGTVTLRNSIVQGNFNEDGPTDADDDISGVINGGGNSTHNRIGTCAGCALTDGVDNNELNVTAAELNLGALANNGGPTLTHALGVGSVAIETGNNAYVTAPPFLTAPPTTDQRGTGFPRIADSADGDTTQTVDIGAYEAHPTLENITDKTTAEDTPFNFNFNLGDDTGTLITGGTVTATSSNQTLVPDANLVITGSGGVRNLAITPAADANSPADGTATITVTVTATNGRTAVDTFVVTVTEVNDNPDAVNDTLTAVNEDSGLRTIPFGDLTGNDTRGPANENGQTLDVTAVSNPVGGTVQINGTNVEFTLAADFSGTASFDYTITDNGTTNGSLDAKTDTATASFTVTGVNDPPSFVKGADQTVNEDAGPQTVVGWATSISAGPGETQTLTFNITPTGTSGNLSFASGPAINTSTGDLTYTTNADTNGMASFSVTLSDDGGGTDTSAPQTFTITVNAVDDAPTFTLAAGPTVAEDAGAQSVPSFASNFQPGPVTATDESTQSLVGYTLTQTGSTGGLTFSGTPAIDNAGTLTYTATGDTSGTATFDVVATDTGSNTPPNVNQSAPQSFTITVTAANDAPVNTVPGPQGTASNTPLTFSSGNGNQISVADADAGASTVQVTLTATDGTLTLNGTTGLSFSFSDGNGTGAGDGTADATMTFRGTLTDINAALNGLTYTPTMGFGGPATLTITSNDLGNTGSGGALSDTDVVNIQVATEITINDASVVEPVQPNTIDMVFTVSLNSPAPAGGVTVNFQTSNGTALSGTCPPGGTGDYTSSSGQVTFSVGQQVKTINIPVCGDAVADDGETFTVTLDTPVNGTIVDGTATGTITGNTAGAVVISELRTSGPGGAGDDFVEIYNNSNSPLTVAASDASAGYGLYKMGADCNATPVLIGVIPNGTVIPARGHYLFVGSAYSLTNYGGTGAAAGNLTLSADIETDGNVGLFTTSSVTGISSVNRLDAVGFGLNTGGVCNLLREADTLPAIAGNATLEHSYFRKMCDWQPGLGCTVPGVPKDSNNNLADFWLADTLGSPATGRLGAPGPENIASPIRRDNANNPGSGGIDMVLLDTTKPSSAVPNRSRDTTSGVTPVTFGTMTLRYRVTNNTGGNVTRLRYRIVDVSTAVQPAGPTADVRALTSSIESSIGPVNDPVTCTAGGAGSPPCNVIVQATTLETPPNQTVGGGYNSTLSSGTITMGTPLTTSGTTQSILINFKLGIEKTGQFRFYIIVEALP